LKKEWRKERKKKSDVEWYSSGAEGSKGPSNKLVKLTDEGTGR
jgi:hypothetical protein